jgi:hypothetical protein
VAPCPTSPPWTAGSKDENYERKITYIDQTRKRVFLDAPITNAIEARYTDTSGKAGTVSKFTFNRTTNVGIENIRGNVDTRLRKLDAGNDAALHDLVFEQH